MILAQSDAPKITPSDELDIYVTSLQVLVGGYLPATEKAIHTPVLSHTLGGQYLT